MGKSLELEFFFDERYAAGKTDVEYMSQEEPLILASIDFAGYDAMLTVNGDCRFEHDGNKYRYEDDLTPDIVKLLREGSIELDQNCFFEVFQCDWEKFDVYDVYDLPSLLSIKYDLIQELVETIEEDGKDNLVRHLSSFHYHGIRLKREDIPTDFTFDDFKRNVLALYETSDLCNVISDFEWEYVEDNYGNIHMGIFYFTENDLARSFLQSQLNGLLK